MAPRSQAGLPARAAALLRAAVARVLPRFGWLRRLAPYSGAGGVRRRRGLTRKQQERVLREWEVLRDRLRGVAQARLADVGDLLRAAELELVPGTAAAAERDYVWAMEAYEAAGKLLDEAVDLPDLAAAVVLADRAAERFAAAHARHRGRRPEAPVRRCFYNPLHGPAEPAPARPTSRTAKVRGAKRRPAKRAGAARRISPRQAAAERRPACASCRLAILAGQFPDVLPALLPVRVSRLHTVRVFVPYYAVPQADSLWSATACGAYDDDSPGRVLRGEHRRRSPAGPARR